MCVGYNRLQQKLKESGLISWLEKSPNVLEVYHTFIGLQNQTSVFISFGKL